MCVKLESNRSSHHIDNIYHLSRELQFSILQGLLHKATAIFINGSVF